MSSNPGASRLVGRAGQEFIRYELSKTAPKAMITAFQAANGLDVPLAAPVLSLCDVIDLPRSELLSSLSEELRDALLAKIEALSTESLAPLLASSFRYTAHPILGKVPIAIMTRMPSLPDSYVVALASSPDLLAATPLHIRQQTWSTYPALFRAHVGALIEPYTHPFASCLTPAPVTSTTSKFPSLSLPPGSGLSPQVSPRGHTEARVGSSGLPGVALGSVLNRIGSSGALYNSFLEEIRFKFVSQEIGGDALMGAYAALRADVVVALNGAGISSIVRMDPIYPIVSPLYDVLRSARSLSDVIGTPGLLATVVGAYGSLPAGSPLVGDLGMVMAYPVLIEWVAHSLAGLTLESLKARMLPKDDPRFVPTVTLGLTGLLAKVMILRQSFDLGSAGEDHVRAYFPALITLLLDLEMGVIPASTTGDGVDPMILGYLAQSPLAVHVFLALLSQIIESGVPTPGGGESFTRLGPECLVFLVRLLGEGISAGLDVRSSVLRALGGQASDEYEGVDPEELQHELAEKLNPVFLTPFVLRIGDQLLASGSRDMVRSVGRAFFDSVLIPLAKASPSSHSVALDFLVTLAPAMGVSPRSVIRTYVLRLLPELDQDLALSPHATAVYSALLESLSLSVEAGVDLTPGVILSTLDVSRSRGGGGKGVSTEGGVVDMEVESKTADASG